MLGPELLGKMMDMAGSAVLHQDGVWPISLALADEWEEQRLNYLPDIPSKVDAALAALEMPLFRGELPL